MTTEAMSALHELAHSSLSQNLNNILLNDCIMHVAYIAGCFMQAGRASAASLAAALSDRFSVSSSYHLFTIYAYIDICLYAKLTSSAAYIIYVSCS